MKKKDRKEILPTKENTKRINKSIKRYKYVESPTRKVVKELFEKGMDLNQIVEATGFNKETIRYHLYILERPAQGENPYIQRIYGKKIVSPSLLPAPKVKKNKILKKGKPWNFGRFSHEELKKIASTGGKNKFKNIKKRNEEENNN